MLAVAGAVLTVVLMSSGHHDSPDEKPPAQGSTSASGSPRPSLGLPTELPSGLPSKLPSGWESLLPTEAPSDLESLIPSLVGELP
ncbi:hypothetical protein IPZ69_13780 [Streptomyces olivochromogenes]|nr:hypothetical protein [Streptomyces olivochromogenes]